MSSGPRSSCLRAGLTRDTVGSIFWRRRIAVPRRSRDSDRIGYIYRAIHSEIYLNILLSLTSFNKAAIQQRFYFSKLQYTIEFIIESYNHKVKILYHKIKYKL